MEDNSIQVASKKKLMAYYEKYMFAVGIFGQLVFYSQGVKIFLTKSATDVSIVGFSTGLISVSSWLIYGILKKDKVVIFANILAVLGALFVIIGIIMHG